MRVAVIGGGAAGFFAALSVKQHHPHAEVHILEKTGKTLSKVKVSGGGRCNVTHHCINNRLMSRNYPRGERFIRKALEQFAVKDAIDWFEGRSVPLKIEDDGRMFPKSNNSQSIIDCLMRECNGQNIRIRLQANVKSINPVQNGFELCVNDDAEDFDKVIVASGGSPKREGLLWLEELGHEIVQPTPSLFTFNIPKNPITKLMGVSVPLATVRVVGTKLEFDGPLLITHWGLSGPAVLKTSAFGAVDLANVGYNFYCSINWLGVIKEHELRQKLDVLISDISKRQIGNRNPFELPSRLWGFILEKSEIPSDKRWLDLSKKSLNKLINNLCNDVYEVRGKTTFKEEFVTAGGVSLSGVNVESMRSSVVDGLYFAGEILDIDGVTGGFNFQAAWTTGFIAGMLR